MDPLLNHKLARLRNLGRPGKGTGLESLTEAVVPKQSSRQALSHQAQFLSEEVQRLTAALAPGNSSLASTAKKVASQGAELLEAFQQQDNAYFESRPEALPLLEAIIRLDGSRPSFLIRNGEVDLSSSIAGQWEASLNISSDFLKTSISAVGRVNNGNSHVGSGFLLDRNLLLTNRHVLQSIGLFTGNKWHLYSTANIDFGYEYQCFESRNRIKLKSVIFSGNQPIATHGAPDHSKTDIALIELDSPAPAGQAGLEPTTATDWGKIGSVIYTIGYPADPGEDISLIYGQDLLQGLFQATYGYKRLAPGLVIAGLTNISERVCHDATTLGGSSGSLVTLRGEEYQASGIHYGGRLQTPAENWSQSLAATFTDPSNGTEYHLEDLLQCGERDLLLQIKR